MYYEMHHAWELRALALVMAHCQAQLKAAQMDDWIVDQTQSDCDALVTRPWFGP